MTAAKNIFSKYKKSEKKINERFKNNQVFVTFPEEKINFSCVFNHSDLQFISVIKRTVPKNLASLREVNFD